MKRIIIITAATASVLFFSACTGAASTPMPSQTPDFKAGMNDGCSTATGEYMKNSDMFRSNNEYHEGWFYGRKKCNPSDSKK